MHRSNYIPGKAEERYLGLLIQLHLLHLLLFLLHLDKGHLLLVHIGSLSLIAVEIFNLQEIQHFLLTAFN